MLVANNGYVSQLDVTSYPPTNSSFHEVMLDFSMEGTPRSYKESSAQGMVFIASEKYAVTVDDSPRRGRGGRGGRGRKDDDDDR